MKAAQIIIAIFLFIAGMTPVFAEEYNVLVIPYCAIDMTRKNTLGSVDIEEMLARKFISKMETDGMANAPTINVLNISIKNNPKINPDAVDPMINIRAISKAYGVPKVLLIMSKTEIQNPNQQKNFWTRLDLPVLTQSEANVRLVTTVTMYNAKTDEVLWSDVYYKQINKMGSGIGEYESVDSKLEAINSYYDELIPKVFVNLKDSKETHAIMLTSLPEDVKVDTKVTKDNPIIAFFENIKNMFVHKHADKEKVKQENKIAKSSSKQLKPDLNMKEHFDSEQQSTNGFWKKFKNIQFKFYIVKQDLKIKNIMKEFENPSKQKEDSTQKTAQKLLKEKQKQIVQKEHQEIIEKKKKVSFTESIKNKYREIVETLSDTDEDYEKSDEKPKYSVLMSPNDDTASSANLYLQTKPRYNSRNYAPQFDSSVNDI